MLATRGACVGQHAFRALIARSRVNKARSGSLCARARIITATSARLCRGPIGGASDSGDAETLSPPSAPSPPPAPDSFSRRSVLVLAADDVMRSLIADAIRGQHDIAEASDVSGALQITADAKYPDVIVAGCFTLDDSRAVAACARLAHELYDQYPWMPVVVVGDAPAPALKAELLLTGVRAYVPRDVTSADLAATVTRLARAPGTPVPSRDRVNAIKQTFLVLENAVTSVPALAALAAMANMSRSHFSRTFHAVAGVSLRDYVRDLRLKRAQHLMRASRLSLTAIATASGFYDLPHFNKTFRQRFGMSPTQFRLRSSSKASAPSGSC